MSSNLTFYTLNEMLVSAASYKSFIECLNDYEALKNVPTLIYAAYQDWYGIWVDEDVENYIAEMYNRVSKMQAWLRLKAVYLNDYITRQSGFTGKQGTTSKYLDTPETEADYSGETHITNLTKTETSGDNALGLETLRPIVESLVDEFRKTWLLPQEVL